MTILKGIQDNYTFEKSSEKGILIGYRESDRLIVCAKKIRYNLDEYHNAFEQFSSIRHHWLVNYLELIHHNGSSYVIREYYSGTSLKEILSTRSLYHKLSETFLIETCIYILKGLNELHQRKVLHLDIKPANIIIRHSDKEGPKEWKPEKAILIDFEQAICYPATNALRNRFSLVYSPPEQLLNRQKLLNPSSDLSALGIVLYELIAGSPPYVDCNAEIVLNLQLTYPIKKRPTMRDDFFEIIKKASNKEPFPKPPRMLTNAHINSILEAGISGRYQNSAEMRNDLQQYLLLTADLKKTWWQKVLKRLGF